MTHTNNEVSSLYIDLKLKEKKKIHESRKELGLLCAQGYEILITPS
jgi:hypothetical protein